MDIRGLLSSHTVTVTRNSETVMSAVSVPTNTVLTNTFTSDAVVHLTATATTTSAVLTGTRDGTTLTETISFASGPLTKVSSNHFDTLVGVSTTAGTGTITAKSKTRMGQPIFSQTAVVTAVKARVDVAKGAVTLTTPAGSIVTDGAVLFHAQALGTIQGGDNVTDDATSTEYRVEDVNEYFDSEFYVYSECMLSKK